MTDSSKYWILVRIDAAGNLKTQSLPSAQAFFATVFGKVTNQSDLADTQIQQQLLQLCRDSPLKERSLLAQRCLLCFISWQIKQVCMLLEEKFGNVHGFTHRDLLPLVLDDDGKVEPSPNYQSFALKILASFDPKQSSLTTWAQRKTKHHPELNRFLLESGVYLISDWAILNDTQPKQVERILREFHCCTPVEIQQAQHLLASYHAVYRMQRLQQRATGVWGACTAPTNSQLTAIAQHLSNPAKISTEVVMAQLQKLASQMREYRIHARGGSLPTDSLDASTDYDYNSPAERIADPNSGNILEADNEQAEFLESYRPQLLACLDEALARVTQSRVQKLERKDKQKAQDFLTALQLFHCQRLSMTDIAKHLGMRAQDTVTRLLKLKDFRADVRQQLLQILSDRVLEIAKNYATPDRLKNLEAQIQLILDEQITNLLAQAESEAAGAKNNAPKSCFTERLCQHLDDINGQRH